MTTCIEEEILKRKMGKEYYLALYPKLKDVNFSLEEWFEYYKHKKKEPEICKIKEDLRNYTVTEICKEHKNISIMQIISKIYREIIPNYLEEDKIKIQLEEKQFYHLIEDCVNDIIGLGPIHPLLISSNITDIMVNDIDNIYITINGGEKNIYSPIFFDDKQHLERIIDKMLTMMPDKNELSFNNVFINGTLVDGSRVNITSRYISNKCSAITIRKHVINNLTLEDMLKQDSLSYEMASFLYSTIKNKGNYVITGSAGSGKTTLLSALSNYIPINERLIIIEDVSELKTKRNPDGKENIIKMETRPPNREGAGRIDVKILVENALRMNPDRIIIGECRDGETVDMLQAMNTGHSGSLTTVHANDAKDLLSRLEGLVLRSNLNINPSAAKNFIATALDYIIHTTQFPNGKRIISQIYELRGYNPSTQIYDLAPLFEYDIEKEHFVFYGDIKKKKTFTKEISNDEELIGLLKIAYRKNLELYITELDFKKEFVNSKQRYNLFMDYVINYMFETKIENYPMFYFVDNIIISKAYRGSSERIIKPLIFLDALENLAAKKKQQYCQEELAAKMDYFKKLSPYIIDMLGKNEIEFKEKYLPVFLKENYSASSKKN